MHDGDDHSGATHTATCDACTFVAETHAHDADSAAADLSQSLAQHNKTEHDEDTDPEKIKDAVRAKMQPFA